MRFSSAFGILLLTVSFCYSMAASEAFELATRIGFDSKNDKIKSYSLLPGSQILLIGKKNLEVWDYENSKRLGSSPHFITDTVYGNLFTKMLRLNLSALLGLNPVFVDPNGKWIITIESKGKKDNNAAIVRKLPGLEQMAELSLPNVSVDSVWFDEEANQIRTLGLQEKMGEFALWEPGSFKRTKYLSLGEQKWYRLFSASKKVIVGSGDTKIDWLGVGGKQGNTLSLIDVETGEVEKQFQAPGHETDEFYRRTTLSKDEKHLVSTRSGRILVWDIEGDGSLRYEVAHGDSGKFGSIYTIASTHFVVSNAENLEIYEISGNGKPLYVLESETQGDTVQYLGRSFDGQWLIAGDDNNVWLLETGGNGTPLLTVKLDADTERFRQVSIIEGKGLLAVGKADHSRDKGVWTEFYDIATGKLESTAQIRLGPFPRLSPDTDHLFDISVGNALIWNFEKQEAFSVPLKYDQPQPVEEDVFGNPVDDYPRNTEFARLSPDGKYLLRYGDSVVAVFDIEKRMEVQTLFDSENVKYNKKDRKVKKSGIREAAWTRDGRFVFGIDSKSRKVSFWKVGG